MPVPKRMSLANNSGGMGQPVSTKKYAITGGMLLKDGKPPIANDVHGDAQLAEEVASLIAASGGTVDRADIKQFFEEKYSLYQPTKGRMGGIIDTGYQTALRLERQQQPTAAAASAAADPNVLGRRNLLSSFSQPGASGAAAASGARGTNANSVGFAASAPPSAAGRQGHIASTPSASDATVAPSTSGAAGVPAPKTIFEIGGKYYCFGPNGVPVELQAFSVDSNKADGADLKLPASGAGGAGDILVSLSPAGTAAPPNPPAAAAAAVTEGGVLRFAAPSTPNQGRDYSFAIEADGADSKLPAYVLPECPTQIPPSTVAKPHPSCLTPVHWHEQLRTVEARQWAQGEEQQKLGEEQSKMREEQVKQFEDQQAQRAQREMERAQGERQRAQMDEERAKWKEQEEHNVKTDSAIQGLQAQAANTEGELEKMKEKFSQVQVQLDEQKETEKAHTACLIGLNEGSTFMMEKIADHDKGIAAAIK